MCEVQHPYMIAFFFKLGFQLSVKAVFSIYDNHAFIGMKNIRDYVASGFACTAYANDKVIVVKTSLSGIVVDVSVLGKDTMPRG